MNRPRPRLARPTAAAETRSGERPTAAATVVRAAYDGNWNPEPLALEVFAGAAATDRGVHVRVVDEPLDAIGTIDPRPDLVVVSGTDAHTFAEPERRAIRAYVERGGVILFETAGGRGPFTQSAEAMCRELLGDVADPARVVADSRIVTGEGLPDAVNVSRVDYRPYAADLYGARETRPRLQGMAIEGTPRVLFSHEDISNALLDQPCWGVAGYAPRSARDLLGNIVLHGVALRSGG
jgi:hypothetical protein